MEKFNGASVTIDAAYEVGATLGEGGFGMVKAVTKRAGSDAGTWYAMKVLKKSAIVERNQVGLTFAEMKLCRLLSSLRSPFLCNLAYAFHDASNCYVVLDLALGGDLFFQLYQTTNKIDEDACRFYVGCATLAARASRAPCSRIRRACAAPTPAPSRACSFSQGRCTAALRSVDRPAPPTRKFVHRSHIISAFRLFRRSVLSNNAHSLKVRNLLFSLLHT